jgi:hypothetical protein
VLGGGRIEVVVGMSGTIQSTIMVYPQEMRKRLFLKEPTHTSRYCGSRESSDKATDRISEVFVLLTIEAISGAEHNADYVTNILIPITF